MAENASCRSPLGNRVLLFNLGVGDIWEDLLAGHLQPICSGRGLR